MANEKKSEAPQNVDGHFDVWKPDKVPKGCRDTTQWYPNFYFFHVCFEQSGTERTGHEEAV